MCSPPNLSSADPCAISNWFLTKHWYIPRSSFDTADMWTLSSDGCCSRAPVRRGWPSLSQCMDERGKPEMLQRKVALLPRSTLWRLGWTSTCSGELTLSCTSKVSLPSLLLALQRYVPASDSLTVVMTSVPSRTMCLSVPSSEVSCPFCWWYTHLQHQQRQVK